MPQENPDPQQNNQDDLNLLIGKSLGQYRIVERMGSGGIATVFKAYQPTLDRYVAVKVLPPSYARDPLFIKRFVQEARIVARLLHRNIVQIHDFGEQDNVPFIVTEYVDGGTLKDLLKQRETLLAPEAIDLVIQAVEGLGYAHSQGIVHGDVKPANILRRKNGQILISDFGIAKILAVTTHLRQAGTGIGTPQYMSPEQGTGQPIDRRSDIYSLGIVLFHALTGRVPFTANHPISITAKHLNDPLPVGLLHAKGIPQSIEQVVVKMTAKAPADRYQTTDALIEALGRTLQQAAQSQRSTAVSKPVDGSSEGSAMEAALNGPLGRTTLRFARLTIGRSPDNGLVVSDPKVSAHHAEIRPEGSYYSIVDLGSINGTSVNERRLNPGVSRVLQSGDTIRIGDMKFSFEARSLSQPGSNATSAPPNIGGYYGGMPSSYGETLATENPSSTPPPYTPAISPYTPPPSQYGPSPYTPVPFQYGPPNYTPPPSQYGQFVSKGPQSVSLGQGQPASKQSKAQLSLFAVARTYLEPDDRAFVGRTCSIIAGISPHQLEDGYRAAPFSIPMPRRDSISFDILLHTSENIKLKRWRRHIEYRPNNQSPRLIRFTFQIQAPGRSSLVLDFYHERRWLRTIRLEFESEVQSQHAPALRGGI